MTASDEARSSADSRRVAELEHENASLKAEISVLRAQNATALTSLSTSANILEVR